MTKFDSDTQLSNYSETPETLVPRGLEVRESRPLCSQGGGEVRLHGVDSQTAGSQMMKGDQQDGWGLLPPDSLGSL